MTDPRIPQDDHEDSSNPDRASGDFLGGPEEMKALRSGARVTRRLVNKVFAAVGVAVLADAISGWRIFGGAHEEEEHAPGDADRAESVRLSEELDAKAKEIAANVEAESHGLSDREKALKVVDYVGCALFAWGIKDLLPGGHGHIHAAHYGALLALTAIKYELSDEHGKHHLKEETVSNARAFGIISGTIVAAEGLDMDAMRAYEFAMNGKKPEKKDQVALVTMLSSVLSPGVTTVGSASVMRKMSEDLCTVNPAETDPKKKFDQKMMAVCVSHISNLSGFLLFGDPPFIAICEKYGFAEGVKWQFETMLPLALYSLARSTYHLNLLLAKREGLSGRGAHTRARADTISGIKNNIPVLCQIIAKSFLNVARYFSAADIKFNQDPGGIEVKIGEILTRKLTNLGRLPFDPKFDKPSHEDAEGMIREDHDAVRGGNELAAGLIDELTRGKGKAADAVIDSDTVLDDARFEKVRALREAISAGDYETVSLIGSELGLPSIDVFVRTLKDFHDNSRVDHSADSPRSYSLKEQLNPLAIYNRASSVHRMKEAIGHNLGDVVDVFPFQAGCVPFLTTAFKDAADGLSGLGEGMKEAVLFFLIMGFSSIADNYVACKIGLELFPDKPHLPLIAAIQGGSLTAIGNMANVAQFNLEQFSLASSLGQWGLHVDAIGAAFAWNKALDILNGLGIMKPPKALKGAGSAETTSSTPSSPKHASVMTRRKLFSFWKK